MKTAKYESLISQNVAPYNTTKIGVYRKKTDKKVGSFLLQNLRLPRLGGKLYSFGALSDVHLQYDTAQADFQKALTFLNEAEDVDFTCICGDLTRMGLVEDLGVYKTYIDTYSPDTPVYSISGNHDACVRDMYTAEEMTPTTSTFDGITPYTGNPLYYSFTKGDDVFVMVGIKKWDGYYGNYDVFSAEALQWLYEVLETNRNKRCIVFQHGLRFDGCGNPYPPTNPTGDLLGGTHGTVFKSLMEHYTNCIWFHGHSHTCFDSQEDNAIANYDRKFGIHSIHIPSLAVPREFENSEYVGKYAESEGYVVDVYKNHIVLRGRDFASEKFLPIATYCIDTTLQTIEANTFTDTTGIINT
jgi:hypothetical protein